MQEAFELLADHCAARQQGATATDADLGTDYPIALPILAAPGAPRPLGLIAEHHIPAGVTNYRFHLCGAAPRHPGCTDDRAHAGADDAIDRHPQFLQDAQNTDVGDTAGAAAAQHETGFTRG